MALIVGSGQVDERRLKGDKGECVASGNLCGTSPDRAGDDSRPTPLPERLTQEPPMDWCKLFKCQGKVKIEGVCYPVTLFWVMGAHQSVCTNVTGRTVRAGRYVMCLGRNSVDSYDCVYVKLDYPIVTG